MHGRHLTVLVAPNPEWGGVTSTIPLAKALRAAGHRIIYVGPPMCELFQDKMHVAWDRAIAHIEGNGFEYITIVAHLARKPAERGVTGLHIINMIFREAVDEVAQVIQTEGVDIALVDAFVWFLAIASARLSIPTLVVKTNLRNRLNWWSPPCTSSRVPRRTLASRLATGVEWAKVWSFWKIAAPFNPGGVPLRSINREVARAGRAVGLKTVLSEFLPEFELPEVVLCPRSFDFPQPRARDYVGAIDSTSMLECFEWPESGGLRRVYCSPGTLTSEFLQDALRFTSTCVAMAAARPDLSMVLQVSNRSVCRELTLPSNVHLYEWLPQAAALQKADVAVIAGGLGTIKECIYADVPMLVVVPSHADKPGNGARVQYHGIGRQIDVKSASPERLGHLLDDVLARGDECRGNMRAIQSDLRDCASVFGFVRRVEELSRLAQRPQ